MLNNGIFLQSLFHLRCHTAAIACQSILLVYIIQNDSCLTQNANSEEVAGHQIREDGTIVAGTESAGNQATRFARMAVTTVRTCIVQSLCFASETVIGDGTVPVLLVLEDVQNLTDSLKPLIVEDAGITCLLPIGIGKTQGIAE